MREILFRGQDAYTGEWAYGFVVDFGGGDRGIISGLASSDYSFIRVIPETIGQYTGLDDKNGVKIFEGDIVKTHFSFEHNVEQEPFIITWNKDKAMFEGVKPEKNKDDYLRSFSFFPEQEFIYEVIGNIQSNACNLAFLIEMENTTCGTE